MWMHVNKLMLIKVFRIGHNLDHGQRVRESMLGSSLEVCPVHLLYKDHKGWTWDKGGVPPTTSNRHVLGGVQRDESSH